MSFKILLLSPDTEPSWPEKIREAVPGAVVKVFGDPNDAFDDIADADAAYGTVPPELLARAPKLRWICAARAGLGGAWFYDALVNSDVESPTCAAATTSILPPTPSRSSSPSPAASITTCRKSAGSEVRR
jgi:hypothetical protein